jgi:hypothetical protein
MKRKLRTSLLIKSAGFVWTLPLWAVLMNACSPMPIVVPRDRVIERNAPIPPAIQVDRFLFDVASGPVTIALFVEDGELSLITANAFERDFYRPLIETLHSDERFRALDPTVALIKNPSNEMFSWSRQVSNLEEFFADVFTGREILGVRTPPFLRHDYLGVPTDPSGILRGLLAEGGAWATLPVASWGVFFYPSRPSAMNPFPVDQVRQKHLLHFQVLHRTSQSRSPRFPNCEILEAADSGRRLIGSLGQADVQEFDLCDPDWAKRARDGLLRSIEEHKKRLILTATPYEPRTMALRGAFQRLQFGTDYIYRESTNEIELKNPRLFQKGDLIEVSYYTGTPNEELPGNPQPGGP